MKWADILPWEAPNKVQKFKFVQKIRKYWKSAKKKGPAILWGIFSFTIVFHTSKKIQTLDK